MSKEQFKEIVPKGKENISVHAMPGDRIIVEMLLVKPKSVSEVINPQTNKPYQMGDWDRHPVRGTVRWHGVDIQEKFPAIRKGTTVFLEDMNAIRPIKINGQAYGLTRLSNVLLVYNENI